jgi:hypothetical protein
MLSSPFRMRRKALKTAYVITDQRAIMLAAGAFGSTMVRSFDPERLKDLRRVQNQDGTGDLIFERTWQEGRHGDMQAADHGFTAIADVQELERRIVSLSQEA